MMERCVQYTTAVAVCLTIALHSGSSDAADASNSPPRVGEVSAVSFELYELPGMGVEPDWEWIRHNEIQK